jgi:serine/threonine protein kinase
MRIPEFFAQLVRDGDGPFQGYAHVKLCGEGAFGVVHRIAPLGGGSPVVVKLPRKPSDPEDAERLARDWERELQRWRLLDRCRMAPAGVVRVQRISPLGYPAWVRLELIDGEPLGEWAGSRGCPDPVQGLRIMRELARRLDALGNVGFGYTDLHQGNVLVREESGVLQPVLIDAGAATPRLQPPEWRGLRLRDLTTERGGPTERLVRGLAWLLARLTCLTLLGSEVADVVTAGSEDDSLAHLEVGTPPTRAADGPPEIELRRMLNRRFGAHGSEHIDTTLVADLILRGLSSDPSRRPEGPAQFAEFVGLCFRSS